VLKVPKKYKDIDRRIDNAYRKTCAGIQINVMDISKVFDAGRALIAHGASDENLGVKLREYVLTLSE
jgi:hypothetical protein